MLVAWIQKLQCGLSGVVAARDEKRRDERWDVDLSRELSSPRMIVLCYVPAFFQFRSCKARPSTPAAPWPICMNKEYTGGNRSSTALESRQRVIFQYQIFLTSLRLCKNTVAGISNDGFPAKVQSSCFTPLKVNCSKLLTTKNLDQ